ncbi:radical SAM protein [Candidatus Methanomassiliicoccus intestinalis]|uniref:DUF8061 domain-containing protein n=1 Tax=Methanomassiliicoccus intestinalis (strain Issoire-Mx1) TaxID=1295009 RepID=R9T8I4_METII|nr:radical SAM protein [Candidatus Methanomassiliicoccus intestinalis]AGN27227.1 hypothetical protein MMINT_19570 [Candidatus Methanomassiliicoccus intestinalis Issoire-Mx1]TQS81730.1 MAG: radical SAM protein [Candidatus Methanomassiliicoccus intestinalis]
MKTEKMEADSIYTGHLPKGCVMCRKGAKLVLLVSGRCDSGCFYCPLSSKKKGKDVIYADEKLASSDEDIIFEAESIDAEGTGITGGDPVKSLDRTIYYIELLKNHFGKKHHIHLYTASLDTDAYSRLEKAGLDELRIHPPVERWGELPELEDFIKNTKMSIGFEIPAIPGKEKEIRDLVKFGEKAGLDFINLNELEFSEGNWDELEKRGFSAKDEISSAVGGSEELAYEIIKTAKMPVHYCSSSFKDAVQLRQRLKRRALKTSLPSDIITEDGTLLKGVVEGDPDKIIETLKNEFEVPEELMHFDKEKERIEVAPWILEEIFEDLPYDSFIVEEYPTADRLEVEREPLKRH